MTEPDSTEFAFGQGVDFNIKRNNNKKRIYGVGQRNAQETVALQYNIALTVNGSLSNAYFLLGALGANANAGGGPTYTHTYTEADVLPTFTAYARRSFDTAKNEVVQGCIINSLALKSAVNEEVKFTLECLGRYDKVDTDSESAVTETEKIFTFAGGVIEIPNGTSIAKIQTFDLTINNTVELVFEVGDRFAAGYVAKNREYNFNINVAVDDYTLLSRLYDGTNSSTAPGTGNGEIATMELTFTNSNSDTIVATFTGVHFNEDDNQTSVGEVFKMGITGWANACTSIVYTNTTETAPAQATNV